eukprot:XP_016661610.1 PREDICTED: sideroflexin-2-like [Acyrthosiphon pisum]
MGADLSPNTPLSLSKYPKLKHRLAFPAPPGFLRRISTNLRLTYKRVAQNQPNGSISNDDITETKLLYAHQIYESVIHPDTNEVQNRFGRLSFIPIGKSLIVGVLLSQLTKNYSSYVWHGLNQSYDSLVNFTNRNGDTKFIPTNQFRFGISILAATATSTLAAFHIERFLLSKICHPILYRFVPLITFAGASFINVPIIRHNEIIDGVRIYDCNKEKVGYSRVICWIKRHRRNHSY